MKKEEITLLINTIWDSVEKSKAGPIFTIREDKTTQLNYVPFNLLLTIVSSLVPKGTVSMKVEEPPESWKE